MNLNDIKNGLSWFADQRGRLVKDPISLSGHPSSKHRISVYSKSEIRDIFKQTAQYAREFAPLERKIKRDGKLPASQKQKYLRLRKYLKKGTTKSGKAQYLKPGKEARCPQTNKVIRFSQLRIKDAKQTMRIFLAAAHEAILENKSLTANSDPAIRAIKKYFRELTLPQRRKAYNELSDFRSGVQGKLPQEQYEFLTRILRLQKNEARTIKRAA